MYVHLPHVIRFLSAMYRHSLFCLLFISSSAGTVKAQYGHYGLWVTSSCSQVGGYQTIRCRDSEDRI